MTAVSLPRRAATSDGGQLVALAALAAAVGVIGSFGADPARALIGACTLVVLFLLAMRSRPLAVGAMVAWLVAVGFTRRFLIPFSGWSEADPLLLVSPAAALLLLLASRDEAPPPRAALASLAAFNVLWAIASVTNPNEGDVLAAARALLFFVAPYLWFFVGRRLTGAEHDLVLRVLLVMAVPVVALGLYQTFRGLLPFEYTWLSAANVDPALIYVRGFNIRPFSTLTSPQEYGVTLGVVGLVLWARLLERVGDRGRVAAALGVVVLALFYQGSRGIFLSFLLAAIATFVLRHRASPMPFVAVTLLVFGVYVVSRGFDLEVSTQTELERERSSTATALFRHQIEGLFNPSETTAGLHADIYLRGLREGLANPLGLGPTRYAFSGDGGAAPGGDEHLSPENQLSITIASLGIAPAAALLAINVIGIVTAVRVYRRRPTARHLAWFGLLLMAGDQALNGRLYLTSMIVALVLGGLATEQHRSRPIRPQVT